MKNTSDEIPFRSSDNMNFSSLRWCKSCNRYKDKTEFIGDLENCKSCLAKKEIPKIIPTYSPTGNIASIVVEPAYKKICIHCNALKDSSEFAIAKNGDSRLCRACLDQYLYLPPVEDSPPPWPWWKLGIAFVIGALIF